MAKCREVGRRKWLSGQRSVRWVGRIGLRLVWGSRPYNKPLAHELESGAVIEGFKPEKLVLLERDLAHFSNRVKRSVGWYSSVTG